MVFWESAPGLANLYSDGMSDPNSKQLYIRGGERYVVPLRRVLGRTLTVLFFIFDAAAAAALEARL